MNLIRDLDNREMSIVDCNGVVVSKLYFVPSYFAWSFSRDVSFDHPIMVSQETDDIFYHNLEWLMSQSYEFPHEYSSKSENKLVWLSEHCFDIEDEYARDVTPRLVIEKGETSFLIYFKKTFIEKNHLPNKGVSISFAPAGNGFLSKNKETRSNFQDDMIKVFYDTLYGKKITAGKVLEKTK